MKLVKYFKRMNDIEEDLRENYVENLSLTNYGSGELSETDMWILSRASKNAEYLENKLKESEEESEELTLDDEAPEEVDSDEELSLDDGESEEDEEESESKEEKEDEEESESKEEKEDEEPKTSKAGAGILPLINEIQDKLANGTPSEVEVEALKAVKKLVDEY